MPAYQIHRLKETQRQQFRWAPHTPGVTIVKLKDYQPGEVVHAATPYALWLALREGGEALLVGDLIELVEETAAEGSQGEPVNGSAPDAAGVPRGPLRILKYIGFEEARWYVPEPAPESAREPAAVS